MARIISVSDDVYAHLTKLKGKESYSKAIRELIATKSNKEHILNFFGKGGVDAKKVKELDGSWRKWSEEFA
ncbi:hypothetical protein J4219_05705 [Candidatus Woesearchaeota archaeon]|nr:hypothetical protein [Candidatus Woesearchaeota archaeon]